MPGMVGLIVVLAALATGCGSETTAASPRASQAAPFVRPASGAEIAPPESPPASAPAPAPPPAAVAEGQTPPVRGAPLRFLEKSRTPIVAAVSKRATRVRLGEGDPWMATLHRGSDDPECANEGCEVNVLELRQGDRARYAVLTGPDEMARHDLALAVVRRPDGAESLLAFGPCHVGSHELMVGAFLVEADRAGEPALVWQGDIDHCSTEQPCRRRPPRVEYGDFDQDGDLDIRVDPIESEDGPPARKTFTRSAAGALESDGSSCAVDRP